MNRVPAAIILKPGGVVGLLYSLLATEKYRVGVVVMVGTDRHFGIDRSTKTTTNKRSMLNRVFSRPSSSTFHQRAII